jgi:hypothetical protein
MSEMSNIIFILFKNGIVHVIKCEVSIMIVKFLRNQVPVNVEIINPCIRSDVK